MLQFLKLLKKNLRKINANQAKEIYLSLNSSFPVWTMIEINSIIDGVPSLFKSIDLQTHADNFNFRINLHDKKTSHEIWKNNKIMFSSSHTDTQNLDQLYNNLIDQIISSEIKKFQKILNESIISLGATSTNEINEYKSLEWLKVSFIVLERAIVESYTNHDLHFMIKMFVGTNPKTNLNEIRLIIFNLDIKFSLSAKGMLEVIVFDDKNEQSFSSTTPVLNTELLKKSRESLDELVKILSVCSRGIKIT